MAVMPMDEIEKRVCALELLWIEAGAWMDPSVLEDAAHSIRDGLSDPVGDDDAEIRRQALSIIEDAQKRFVGHGWVLRPKR
ncbi:hypothetical protein [Caulobacter sp. UNC279MFTsu5.1]|uniref:hypothetical protein n=1 Tax=Caulobacter sp. UNC279MFTsu5.1 TaxID=1502775 RepID=UPI0011606210|nr:hypothetical protein [Caulobacter sp. UNC279MFTsu5.1]